MLKDLFVYFFNYEKAFDKVKHVELFNILKTLNINGNELQLLRNLYWKQKAAVRVGNEESTKQEIRRGVRQGCVISPELFSMYSEIIMNDLTELDGIELGGR